MSHTYIKTLLLAGAFTTAMQPAMSANIIDDYDQSTDTIKTKKGILIPLIEKVKLVERFLMML